MHDRRRFAAHRRWHVWGKQVTQGGSMRIIAALFVLASFCPTLIFAQVSSGPKPAGVVTNLAGAASVVRLAAAEPSRLQFKDRVYAGDRISTAADSTVRVLLGGKALITIREFSNFTITEEPNRSTVNLASGSVTLAVARQRMKPGEQVDVRTPNAIAAVRGTVLLVEVEPPAAGGAGGEQSVSTFSVLKGSVEVSCAAAGCSGNKIVHALEAVRVSGLQMGAVEAISPARAASLAGRFHVPLQPMDSPDDGNRQKMAKQEMSKAMALAAVLVTNSVSEQATGGEAKSSSREKAEGNAAAAPGQAVSSGDGGLANASFRVSEQMAESEGKHPSTAAGGNAAAAPGQAVSHGDAALVSASLPLVSSPGSTIAASAVALVPVSPKQQSQSQTLLPGSGAGPAPLLAEVATEKGGSSGSGNGNSSFSQRAQERRNSRR